MREQNSQTTGTGAGPLRAAFVAIFAALTFYLLLAANAFAAGGGAQHVAHNLGDMLSTIGSYVLLGIAGLMAIGMIASRKFSAIGGLLIMVFLVGGLVLAPDLVTRVIRDTWDTLARGS